MNANQDITDNSSVGECVDDKLKKVIASCKDIVNNSRNALGLNNQQIKKNEKNTEDITLEKVVKDMTYVLYDLKNGIKLVKSSSKIQSHYNVESELERLYREQEAEKKKLQEEEEKKKVDAIINKKQPTKSNNIKPGVKNKVIERKQNVAQKKGNPAGITSRKSISTRPSSVPYNNKIVNKTVVTTVNFPTNNLNTTTTEKTQIQNRPKSNPEQSLRKSAPKVYGQKVVSVPVPREVYNPLGIIKDEVERAIRDRKTFTIKGMFPAVRRALLNRGWVEKYHPNYREKINEDIIKYNQFSVPELVDLLRNKDLAQTIKKLIKSKLLSNHQVDLYWDHSFDAFKECPDTKKLTLINRFRRESFSYTSKQGLCQAARENYWLQIPGVAKINHPRCYVLAKGGDTNTFLKDFGLTAATCLLKWVVKNNITGESKIVSRTGKIPMKTFDFALTECYKFIKTEKHQDIDEEIRDALELEWNQFLEQFYKIVHIGNHFKLVEKSKDPSQVAKEMVRKSNYLLNELREYMPCLDMDGYMNIWILKPINSSRGIGIHICRTIQYIFDLIKKNPTRRYVIQKYIERPLLIHDTKFDIRQWFLVSSSCPLTIWIYKICYLRFSSQTYNLRKLHESIHLTNNSVQAKYMNNVSKDPLLPSYGMWNSQQFKSYLADIGYPSIYEETIYPGMKQCLTGAMIAHRDKIDKRKNCFELYGADFMLTENFEPWLLEINSNPALHNSTPVTAKLCPQVLEDVIKVVVDNARNNSASTGNFELIYKEKLDDYTANAKENFQLTGTPVPESYFCDIPEPKHNVAISKNFETPDPGRYLIKTGETMKEALKKLLEIVKKERMKRHLRREKAVEVNSLSNSSSTNMNREIVSIYQNTLSTISCHSEKFSDLNISNQEQLSEEESKKITKVLSHIASLQSKKQLLSGLVKIVDNLANSSKKFTSDK